MGEQISSDQGPTSAAAQPKLQRGLLLQKQGRLTEAERAYREILQQTPLHFDALYLLGQVALQTGRTQHGADLMAQAIALDPNVAAAHSMLGSALRALNRHEEALASFDRAIALEPRDATTHFNRANALADLNRHDEALTGYDRALALNSNFAAAHNNRGIALSALKRHDEALAAYDRAIASNLAYAVVHNNRGIALYDLKRHAEAAASYDRAIALKPDYAEAHSNRGNALIGMWRHEEAVASFDRAIALRPDYVEAHLSRAIALKALKRYDEALASFERVLALKPDQDFVFGDIVGAKMRICDWRDWGRQIAALARKIDRAERTSTPFAVMAAIDSAALQKKTAKIFVHALYPANDALPKIAKRQRRDRIRLGYFSADFRTHATAFLIAELFERHNRARFELIAFSFGPDQNDEMRRRTSAAFDRFIDVRDRPDEQVALLARELEIDIAVNLGGYTPGNRTGIFSLRAAPIQVNYLGYPGTMGAEYMDYLIADPILIPPSSRQYFAEWIVYLPHCYQPNDTKRRIAEKILTRADAGLPERGFVFCCFNNSYKITPEVFDCWMRILKQVPTGIIWLYEGNATVATNLRKEAAIRGVAAERLVFAPPLPLPEHLARHRLADLFLDTLPCNAHTTASDALWAGLPVLTQIGETFAGRVAASLLNAISLPELVTSTRQAYEALAIELATHPEKLAAIKYKLAENRLTAPLFDIGRYMADIEAAYTAMYERYQADLPPGHIYVPSHG